MKTKITEKDTEQLKLFDDRPTHNLLLREAIVSESEAWRLRNTRALNLLKTRYGFTFEDKDDFETSLEGDSGKYRLHDSDGIITIDIKGDWDIETMHYEPINTQRLIYDKMTKWEDWD